MKTEPPSLLKESKKKIPQKVWDWWERPEICKWNTNFHWEVSTKKTGLPFQVSCLIQTENFKWNKPKVVLHLHPNENVFLIHLLGGKNIYILPQLYLTFMEVNFKFTKREVSVWNHLQSNSLLLKSAYLCVHHPLVLLEILFIKSHVTLYSSRYFSRSSTRSDYTVVCDLTFGVFLVWPLPRSFLMKAQIW